MMRRKIKDRFNNVQENRRKNYIKQRISQLMDDMNKAHSEHDKNWYNRLIQELNWVQQADSKPDRNCYMEVKGATW